MVDPAGRVVVRSGPGRTFTPRWRCSRAGRPTRASATGPAGSASLRRSGSPSQRQTGACPDAHLEPSAATARCSGSDVCADDFRKGVGTEPVELRHPTHGILAGVDVPVGIDRPTVAVMCPLSVPPPPPPLSARSPGSQKASAKVFRKHSASDPRARSSRRSKRGPQDPGVPSVPVRPADPGGRAARGSPPRSS